MLNNILEIDDHWYDIVEILGLLLYIEDRDYLSRKKPTYSVIAVLKRKIKYENIFSKLIKKWDKKKENLKENLKKEKTLYSKIKCLFKYIKSGFKQIKKFLNRVRRNLFRGYSTIEQQVIRRTIMKPYTYNYLFRRKFFIDRVYLKAFIRSYKIRKIKNRGLKTKKLNFFRGKKERNLEKEKKRYRKHILDEIKIEFLIYYYIEVYDNPNNISELLDAISNESAQNIDNLWSKLDQYETGDFKLFIEKELLNLYSNIKGEKLRMRMEYDYDDFSKEIYIKKNGKTKQKLASLSSKPKEYKEKIAYISPYDFETKNNIYIYDMKKGEKEKILSWETDKCPKYIEWYNEYCMYLLLGETYGTVEIGGDLYLLNIISKTKTLVKKFSNNIQITKIELLNEDSLKVIGIEYIDDNMNERVPYEEIIKIL